MRYEVFSQITSIAKQIETKHILKAIISPFSMVEVLKYHYRRVPERSFVEFLVIKWGCTPKDIGETYRDFDNHSNLWRDIEAKLEVYPSAYGLQMTRELRALYLITRLLRPQCVVETGVSGGASSTYILRALHDNEYGNLYSLDLPPANLPSGKSSGWLVPKSLRERWSIRIGDSKNLLQPLLNDLGKIDFFIHDRVYAPYYIPNDM